MPLEVVVTVWFVASSVVGIMVFVIDEWWERRKTMSDDGAHLGITPERALETILGGKPEPAQEERLDVRALQEQIMAATSVNSYDDACMYAARLILEFWEEDPDRVGIPTETVYETDSEGRIAWEGEPGSALIVRELGLYDRMKEAGVDLGDLGLTGFQWGWACNAALKVWGLPPAPNPAILHID